ncbi:hypothetical protein KV102_07370 [Mumia sp. zg.B53]|uniref:FtsX-like permease family protein n=2 Tax=unclassified Mumia TaxID=2621872 RepID=UPI001C6E8E9C|nr:FtsX-like permease family protein [Mumia sp. zg.B53]MBW9214663.1 hypothetical protein [Mumia sp. zg.B53]
MNRRSGVARLLLRYVVALRGVLALTATVVVVLAFFASAAPVALANLLTDAQRHALVEISPAARDLVDEQQITPPPELVADDWRGLRDRLEKTRAELPPLLRSVTEPAAFTLTASTRKTAEKIGGPMLPDCYVNLTLSPDLPRHVTMVEGTLPRPPAGERATADLILTRAAAEEARWRVGDVRVLTGGGLPDRRYRLSGTYEAVAPQGPFWRQISGGIAPVVTTTGGRWTVAAAGWVSAENLHGTGPASVERSHTALKLWYPATPERLTAAEGAALVDELSAFTRTAVELAPESEVEVPGEGFMRVPAGIATFSTNTTGVLREADDTAVSLTSLTALLASAPVAAALCVLVLSTGLVRSRSGTLLALARARGASATQLAAAGAVVGLIVGLPAAALGAAVAAAVHGAVPWWPAVLCGLLPAVTAALAATPAGERGPRVPRVAVELAVILLAVASVVAVSQRGLGTQTGGVDPLLIAAPVLVCLAGAVLARRLLPMLARRVAAVQRRRTGLVGLLGAARTRDDRVSPAAVVSLVAALGAATFAGCAVATLDAGRAATAAEAAGADLRVSGSSLDPERVAELSRLADVRASVTLTDGSDVSVRSGTTAYATRVLTDALALEDVQRDVPGAVPGVDRLAAPIDGRVPVVVSQALADSLEGERDVTVDRVPSRVVAVGPARLAGVPDQLWVLADRDALGDERPEYDPVLSVLSSTTGAPPPALARRAARLFPDATVTTPAREETVLAENPVVAGVDVVAGVAAAMAALLVGVTVVMALVAGAASRTRDLAVVRALGLAARRARVLPLWEVGLLVVVAGAVGAVVGVVLPLLLLGAIDLHPFTGGDARPPTTFPVLWLALVAVGALLVTVAGALLAAEGSARRELTSSLRMMGE